MRTNTGLTFIRFALILGVLPFALQAYEFGPDPGFTGAPGDNKTSCVNSGCHSGTVNAGPGNVKILLPSGNTGTYIPGQSMQILVQITDSTKKAFGFQITARQGAANTTQAGDFSTTDGNTQVLCGISGNAKANGKVCSTPSPLEYMEHSSAGFNASINTSGTYTYSFSWTPPAAGAGNVTLYAAANAGPGLPAVQSPTNVYTSNLTLTPAASGSGGPTIDPGGIVPVDSTSTTIQPGSWASIYSFTGKNLAATTTIWAGDFPTKLGGVTVTVNGKPAYLWFVSPSQINFQAPDDTATGSVPVVVTNDSGSTTSTVTLGPAGPAFLVLGDGKHATGLIFTPAGGGSQGGGTYDFVGPTSTGAGFRPVKKGEPLVLYGIGFGPTNPVVLAGKIFSSSAKLVTNPQITLGGVPLTLDFAGLVGAGLYQFNFTVPATVGSGDQPLQAIANGITTPANIFVPVQ